MQKAVDVLVGTLRARFHRRGSCLRPCKHSLQFLCVRALGTGMQLDRKFAVCLLDFEFACCGRYAEGVIVGCFYDHGCVYQIWGRSEGTVLCYVALGARQGRIYLPKFLRRTFSHKSTSPTLVPSGVW